MTKHFVLTPIGPLCIHGDDHAVSRIDLPNRVDARVAAPESPDSLPEAVRRASEQLEQYFRGERREFDIPLDPQGTPFQLRVWNELLAIPYGETISYGELASRIDHAGAARAVGAANGSNPLPIVIPCHRVIGANGKLTGYGGGLEAKEELLQLESRQSSPQLALPG